ncbi:MAG: hypothetical protein H7A46_02950 [Verrucomicrobiales bacterium]|nr:hypothetical protein [Verrucomicrobiales bacterium]
MQPRHLILARSHVANGVVLVGLILLCRTVSPADNGPATLTIGADTCALFPAATVEPPQLPSPCRTPDGREFLTARTEQGDYVVVPVTITPGTEVRPWEAPLTVDAEDFPTLADTGIHSNTELSQLQSITGRSLAEITRLARPGGLSSSGFLAADEDVRAVLVGDNRLVTRLGLTHPKLARPLLHVCNLIRTIHQESGRRRTNEVFYEGHRLTLEIEFSRGGQQSIFDDGLDGAWAIRITRELEPTEQALIDRNYGHLAQAERDLLRTRLTCIFTGEMQPFYIYRYGFYEGHTEWRTDPIAIAFLFGLKPLEEIEATFSGRLHETLTRHFVGEPPGS